MQHEQAIEQPVEPPEDVSGGQPEVSGNTEIAKQALNLVYGDAKLYALMLDLLKKSADNIIQGAADVTGMILDKLGDIDMNQVQDVIPIVAVTALELSEKAGFVQDVNENDIKSAIGLSFKNWGTKNPDKLDQDQLKQMAESEEGKNAMSMAQSQPQPQQMQPEPGLLEG